MHCGATRRRVSSISTAGCALPAFVPPNERRGLVLIDPPFEAKDEFERLARAFTEAFAKWPTGAYLLWYPVKSRRATDELAHSVAAAAANSRPAGKCLRLEFSVAPQETDAGLVSTGLLMVRSAMDTGRRTQDHPARTREATRSGRRGALRTQRRLNLDRQHPLKSSILSVGNLRGTVLCSSCYDWLYVPLPRMVAAE